MGFSQADEWAFKMAVAVVQAGKIPEYHSQSLEETAATAASFVAELHKQLATFYKTLPQSGSTS
ncbi:MAG: hypothetical protein BGO49_11355 [Planctomycetales bacterium 71-10]|nr:MAG: hypothetical protein BGO49_11355 [Planctomycetales bacterium 71-10]